MRGEQAIFNLEIKKKSGLSINPDIHHSKVFSLGKSIFFMSYTVFRAVNKGGALLPVGNRKLLLTRLDLT